jgi:hypothetical protein
VGAEWRPRAFVRAELVERGVEVDAIESFDEAELLLRTGARRPQAVVFDLDGEAQPAAALRTLARLVSAERVLVLTSAGALPAGEVRRLGFAHVLARPFMVRDVVSAVEGLMATPPTDPPGPDR